MRAYAIAFAMFTFGFVAGSQLVIHLDKGFEAQRAALTTQDQATIARATEAMKAASAALAKCQEKQGAYTVLSEPPVGAGPYQGMSAIEGLLLSKGFTFPLPNNDPAPRWVIPAKIVPEIAHNPGEAEWSGSYMYVDKDGHREGPFPAGEFKP